MTKTLPKVLCFLFLGPLVYADNALPPAPQPITPMPSTAPPQTVTTPPPAPPPPSSVTPVVKETPAVPVKPVPVINCNYHISPSTLKIDQSVVSIWAQNATKQFFDLNFSNIDSQVSSLKACFTEQGWQSFSSALLQSGNINAIKTQNLMVIGQIDGVISITPSQENQWKATIPMQVVYQNEKERLTQLLTVDLLIGRKPSGDLGVMQMIAVPRETTSSTASPVVVIPTTPPQ